MAKTSEEIVNDLRTYFNDPNINQGRWKVAEVNMKLNREKNNAIDIRVILLPRISYRSLDDLR